MLFSLVIFQLSTTSSICFLGWLCSYHSKRTQFFKLTLWCRKYQPGPKVKYILCYFPLCNMNFLFQCLSSVSNNSVYLSSVFPLTATSEIEGRLQPRLLQVHYTRSSFRSFSRNRATEQSHSTSVR